MTDRATKTRIALLKAMMGKEAQQTLPVLPPLSARRWRAKARAAGLKSWQVRGLTKGEDRAFLKELLLTGSLRPQHYSVVARRRMARAGSEFIREKMTQRSVFELLVPPSPVPAPAAI